MLADATNAASGDNEGEDFSSSMYLRVCSSITVFRVNFDTTGVGYKERSLAIFLDRVNRQKNDKER